MAGCAAGRRHRDQRLHGERAALLSAGATGRARDALGAAPARERLQPRAAPADGVFRQGDHRPARQPHHQRHRADPAAVRAGAVRDAAGRDGAARRRRRDGVARLAADADRADADSGDGADRARLSAAIGACGDALARAAQRHQRADGRKHRRHERAAGDRRRTALRHAFREHQSRALQGPAGRGTRQRVAAASRARHDEHPADRRDHRGVRHAIVRRARDRAAVRVHHLRRARGRAADLDHDAVLVAATGAGRRVARQHAARRGRVAAGHA